MDDDDDGCVDVPLNSGESDGPCDESSKTAFVVKILDFAQQTFEVRVEPTWTVERLKQVGVAVHRVPVALQRLVYSGKLLQDDATVGSSGIKPGSIVHLFPKPRVVIQGHGDDRSTSAESNSGADANSNDPSSAGARVPTIVLDADEAQQRSQILVLGSAEYMEAQNNVKLFSFMLLVISSIELLNLLAMAMGVPPDGSSSAVPGNNFYPSDDIPTYDDAGYDYWQNHNNSTDPGSGPHGNPNLILYPNRSGWPNTVDWIISAAGVYVALMGIQATNENTRRLARVYLIGTVGVGIGWMLYNYFLTVQIDEAIVAQQPSGPVADMDEDDIYKSALSVMVLPGMVWVLCCLRAAQFHQLLSDAESEAEGRIRAQMEESSALTRSAGGAAAAAAPSPPETAAAPARPSPATLEIV
jgi:Ubiquitin family